jgi:hypothetical protein
MSIPFVGLVPHGPHAARHAIRAPAVQHDNIRVQDTREKRRQEKRTGEKRTGEKKNWRRREEESGEWRVGGGDVPS